MAPEKPVGYDEISQRIGEDRKKMLVELENEGGQADVGTLCDKEHADIKQGSVNNNVHWLQGEDVYERPFPWWPDDAPPLIEEVGRVPTPGGGHPTREVALTDYGAEFVEYMREAWDEPETDLNTFDDVRVAAQSNSERINDLAQTVDSLQDEVATTENDSQSVQERLDSIESDIETLQGHIKTFDEAYTKLADSLEQIRRELDINSDEDR